MLTCRDCTSPYDRCSDLWERQRKCCPDCTHTDTPRRIQRTRVAGWRMPEWAIYVGRPTVFGNPWAVVGAGTEPGMFGGRERVYTVEGPGGFFRQTSESDTAHQFAADLYRSWLEQGNEAPALMCRRDDETAEDRKRLAHRRARILGQLHTLRGRDLACWCAPGLACHADVLLELANLEVNHG
ncbi:DUF4326 domain-containing protein [Mycolicibacterium goodii]|nr:DUF4326 domain-containing protein [Mycolicibacterium goodii]